ncbi:hypothetical protein [Microbacterium sp.]|uniref:hypothetical protein n=1 Tax=Microbacterium sp. TaxID=51671 RepID=UPI001AD2B7BB|nr:hypothetical protein [Microbacterium sp.]MBN9155853.1 hypothetical protein [Microbacterium sp.]
MNRVRVRRNRRTLTPRAYWKIRGWSPALMLVGVAVGGYFVVRTILVVGVGGAEYPFGWDVPIAGLLELVWAVGVFFALNPPLAAVASPSRPSGIVPALVAPLDVRSMIQFIVAAPFLGVLVAFTPFLIPTALGWAPGIPANLPLGLPLSVGLTSLIVLMTWIFIRSLRHGVALTSTTLTAYGYFRTQRFERHAIDTVSLGRAGGFTNLGRVMLRNYEAEGCIQLTLANGSQHRLSASLTPVGNFGRGLEIIQTWVEQSEHRCVDPGCVHVDPH